MLKLRTEIERIPLRQPIGRREGILLLGSCFTDHIGSWLRESWLPVCVNPFGVLFNPASSALSLRRVMAEERVGEFSLNDRNGLYYSFAHHGQFCSSDPLALNQQLIALDQEVHEFLGSTRHILVTFGTAWIYERKGEVVANCHKFPASEFTRRRLSVLEIVDLWRPIIEALPDTHFIFTVSPIRHVKDTLHGNQLSKSTLLLSIEALQEQFGDRVEYLPVYELLVDDLRDYRFYADDLVHPSSLAVEAVKELVSETCFTPALRDYMVAAAPIVKALQHRPSDPDSEQYKQFLRDTLLRKDALLAQF